MNLRLVKKNTTSENCFFPEIMVQYYLAQILKNIHRHTQKMHQTLDMIYVIINLNKECLIRNHM